MSLKTHSKFYFGFAVDADTMFLDFNEGAAELTAILNIGSYTMSDFASEIARAMNAVGTLNYVVTIDRATRLVTIAGDSAFSLLITSGSHAGTSVFANAGFSGADLSAAATYTGTAVVGLVYATQFILQSYRGPDDYQNSTYGTVNKSASGKLEVVSYGNESFVECEIMYANDVLKDGPIRHNPTGLTDLRNFMKYLITKAPLEFMEDENTPGTFINVVLESTADDPKGLKYKLRELYTKNLPGFFETGLLTFRVQN